jgi:hypothetical protein
LTKGELVFADPVKQFDAGYGGGCAIIVLESEHGPGSGLDTSMILLDRKLRRTKKKPGYGKAEKHNAAFHLSHRLHDYEVLSVMGYAFWGQGHIENVVDAVLQTPQSIGEKASETTQTTY